MLPPPDAEQTVEPRHGIATRAMETAHRGAEFTDRPRQAVWQFLKAVRAELSDPLTPVLALGSAASAVLGSPVDAVLVGSVLTGNSMLAASQRLRAESRLNELLAQQIPPARKVTFTARRFTGLHRRSGRATAARRCDRGPHPRGGARRRPAHRRRRPRGRRVHAHRRVAAGGEADRRHARRRTGRAPLHALRRNHDRRRHRGGAGDRRRRRHPGAPRRRTGLQRACRRSVWNISSANSPTGRSRSASAGGLLVSGLGLLRGRGLRQAVASGIAITVAAVPEGMPLVATLAQAASARRLTKFGALVRVPRSVEALGRIDVVCFDKTGTLSREPAAGVAGASRRGLLRDDVLRCAAQRRTGRQRRAAGPRHRSRDHRGGEVGRRPGRRRPTKSQRTCRSARAGRSRRRCSATS